MKDNSQYSSMEDIKNSLKTNDKVINELFKTYHIHTSKKHGFESLTINENDKKVFMKLFNKGLIHDDNKEDFFYLLDIILFTKIMLEAKEFNYKEPISKKKKLQPKIKHLEDTYKILHELELLGVQNSSLETIKKAKNELSKVILDLECIKDDVEEIKRNYTLFLDYEIKAHNNIQTNQVSHLAPYYRDSKNDNDIVKVFSDDYKDYMQVLENKTVTKEDIIRLSSITFITSLDKLLQLAIPYNDKINFVFEVYNHFFGISKSLIDNRVNKLKYHSIKVHISLRGCIPFELSTTPKDTTQSITLKH